MAKLLILAASNGKNLELSSEIQTAAEKQGHEAMILDLCDLGLPLYTPQAEKENEDLEPIRASMEHILWCVSNLLTRAAYATPCNAAF